ncbi:aminodeoxychorismate lyase [Klebsiella sp. BIGb0407]|uniref:aminodeoxychorismate lyase n=1 Tax=Klebsiella sp. BIGb0407 TaxID=2940603 RepID=UPI00216830AA|nr:aminodeoxychorismate lyase [Klebsiella sp. BIGb0407]MCS3433613.1 4-amino-4-deoxychorismate lyase [Klebsiella sp. BIGb0407]
MHLINGQWQSDISASDRAIQFGDGCFTTARISSGMVCHQQDHLRRLQQACEVLMITEVDWQTLAHEMRMLASENPDAVLKVIISRGSGGRGYSASHCESPVRILSVFPHPTFYQSLREKGIKLALSPVRLGQNPALAGIKHLNRLEQVLIRTHLERTDAEEALVLDSEGRLVECCAANLFWRKGEQVFTPYVNKSGVNGTMRQRIMACLENSRWHCSQVSEPLETLADADEVIICNALMPVIPVRQAENWHYPTGALYHFLDPLCE